MGERLGAYVDGEMAADEAGAIEAHLATCPPCAAEVADVRGLRQLFSSAAAVPPAWPTGVRRAVHDQVDALLDELALEQQSLLRIARVLAAVAASVLLAAGIWLGVGRSSPPSGGPNLAASLVSLDRPAWEQTAVAGGAGTGQMAGEESPTASPEWIVADLSAGRRGAAE